MKFETQLKWLKSTIEIIIEIDMTNCDVSMMSCLHLVTNEPKIRPFRLYSKF